MFDGLHCEIFPLRVWLVAPTKTRIHLTMLAGAGNTDRAGRIEIPATLLHTNARRNHSPESETTSTCSIVVGKQNNYVEVSDGFCRLVGYSRVELLQMKLEDLAAPGTADITTSFNPSKATG